ncbi:hypothetical protein LY76DRAFT_379257 [Colletotrichum caudatum]|nr:hypothetical protein LY76DRAFT_379257 [Colletotrichum caudatum]
MASTVQDHEQKSTRRLVVVQPVMHDGMTLWHPITSPASWGGWTSSMSQVRAPGSPSVRGSCPLRSKSIASCVLSRLHRDSVGSRIAARVCVPIREVASLPPLPSLLPRFCGGEIGAAREPVTLHVRRCVDTHLLAQQRAAKTFAVQAGRQAGRQSTVCGQPKKGIVALRHGFRRSVCQGSNSTTRTCLPAYLPS